MTQKRLTEREMAKQFRQMMQKKGSLMRETSRAEALAYGLSFQSTLFRERHAWIETSTSGIRVELEDWENEPDEWDNAYARVTVNSLEDAVELTQDWLSGKSLHKYANLNKTYEKIKRVPTSHHGKR